MNFNGGALRVGRFVWLATPKIKVRAKAPWVIAPPQSRDLVDLPEAMRRYP